MSSVMFPDDKIEVMAFGVIAEKITDEQLKALGEDGFTLINGWNLNAADYGANQHYFVFSRFGFGYNE